MFDESFDAFGEQLIGATHTEHQHDSSTLYGVWCSVCPKGTRKTAELEQVIVDDDHIGVPQAVKEMLVVMVEHLRTIFRNWSSLGARFSCFSNKTRPTNTSTRF